MISFGLDSSLGFGWFFVHMLAVTRGSSVQPAASHWVPRYIQIEDRTWHIPR